MGTTSQPNNKGRDEVYEWIKQLQKNPDNEIVKQQLVLEYERLVISIARKYSKNSDIHEDLVQVGMIGLLAAINRFDMTLGKTFESFAIPTIIGEMKRFIRDKTWGVHVPRRIKELGPKIKNTVDELIQANQKVPTITEIANQLEVSEEIVLEAMEMGQSYNTLSVDHQMDTSVEGKSLTMLDVIGDLEKGYQQTDHKVLLDKILPILTEREQEILKYTYFENLSQKEIGDILGISQMHVSRLLRMALRKLRQAIQSDSSEVLD